MKPYSGPFPKFIRWIDREFDEGFYKVNSLFCLFALPGLLPLLVLRQNPIFIGIALVWCLLCLALHGWRLYYWIQRYEARARRRLKRKKSVK